MKNLSNQSRYFLTDDDFEPKCDLYKISINSIVSSSVPTSVPKLEELLDDNGYYGRYRIDSTPTKNFKNNYVKVDVYLPDSVFNYVWPLNGYYSIADRDFVKRKKPRVIKNNENILYCMYYFLCHNYRIVNSIEPIAELMTLQMGRATRKEYIDIIKFLAKEGFFKDGWFALKHQTDVKEVYENLFDFNYF